MAVSAAARAGSIERDTAAALAQMPHARTRVGACVIDLRDGSVVFERNANTALVPASTMKLFAMSVALAQLGPEFQFETVLATDGSDLIVFGDGDPATGDEKLSRARGESVTAMFEQWADALQARGINEVAGNLILDESIFDNERLHPSWEARDLGKWFAAPVGGLNFNDNCVDITIHPGKDKGSPVNVRVQPPNSLVRMINKCKTGDGTPILRHPPGTMEYKISGRCGKAWPFGPVAFPDPGLLFADALRTVLAKQGVVVRGEIRRARLRDPTGAIPTSLRVVAIYRTPIADVLRRAGKNSQNLFAECLFKRAGFRWARRIGRAEGGGSFALGAAAVVGMLDSAGVDVAGLRFVDGSGLSRDNAVTATQLTHLLVWARRQPWGRMLHDNLSVAGVDGSLAGRMKNLPNRVFAKTGTMRGVRALAGYVDDDSGPRFAFAVVFNEYKGPSTPYKKIQDRICRVLCGAADESSEAP